MPLARKHDDAAIWRWRHVDRLTYAAIGRRLGVSLTRAINLCRRVDVERRRKESGTIAALPSRAYSALRDLGLPQDATPADVAERLPDLRPLLRATPNCGPQSVAAIEAWLKAEGVLKRKRRYWLHVDAIELGGIALDQISPALKMQAILLLERKPPHD